VLFRSEGLAGDLALYQSRYGDWRELFHQVDNLEKVSKADIRRVANQTFVPTNRTVGIIQTVAPTQAQAASQNGGGQ
jgi:predicted Zn-dependent peptidase